MRLLLLVHERPGLTAGDLVEMSFLERTIVSKGVTQLSKKKRVKRCAVVADASDRVRLTETGEETARRAREIALSGIDDMMSVLTPHEREIALEKLTHKVSTDLEKVLRSERGSVPAERQAAVE